ncbi:MAG TPA: phosphatase PAP2 family protein [Phaeodactylibacter sp.]|nr:phosphatase PAP2 family protein [Phaeodactylibacter sp.]
MRKINFLWAIILVIFLVGCQNQNYNPNFQQDAANADYIHRSMKKLTDVIVHDIISPPVAARDYAYPSIAAYEALLPAYPTHRSFAGQLNGLTDIPKPDADKEYCFPLASVHALLKTGESFIFDVVQIEDFRRDLYLEMDSVLNMPKDVFDRSIEYGEKVANHILDWSKKDNYNESRSFPKYEVPFDNPGLWKPTPPDFMDGIEPHWNKIRPFVLKDLKMFVPDPPTEFSTKKGSKFYKETMEVHDVVSKGTQEQKEIAMFWDCNPFVSTHNGHAMFATKKISPGGHWIGISQVAAKKSNANIMQTIEAYTMVSVALHDAFIACWDEKYRSNLVRPETVINTFFDKDWKPLLQTPPFPEHTSGHSVISAASALVLTKLYGDNFAYTDDVEVEYGLKARSFTSFVNASEEAAISRLYGGIHYRPAIVKGVTQGKKVGKYVLANVNTRK